MGRRERTRDPKNLQLVSQLRVQRGIIHASATTIPTALASRAQTGTSTPLRPPPDAPEVSATIHRYYASGMEGAKATVPARRRPILQVSLLSRTLSPKTPRPTIPWKIRWTNEWSMQIPSFVNREFFLWGFLSLGDGHSITSLSRLVSYKKPHLNFYVSLSKPPMISSPQVRTSGSSFKDHTADLIQLFVLPSNIFSTVIQCLHQ